MKNKIMQIKLFRLKLNFLFLVALIMVFSGCTQQSDLRSTISLNGNWQLAISNNKADMPSVYPSTVPVPGLVDMALPLADTGKYENKTYWYRREFSMDDAHFPIVKLKIHKAQYFTRVYVNNKFAGESPYCFTPIELDIKQFLRKPGEVNEIAIAIGCRNNLPDTVVNGHDFEKISYIPGIYDDVEILSSGAPYIANIQTVPDIENKKLRVVAELDGVSATDENNIQYIVRELASHKVVSQGKTDVGKNTKADFIIDLPNCKLWTPETPFLYELELITEGDNKKERFGMRSFRFDKNKKIALLNGKPYYMRGTNVCIHRFFEDAARKNLPWKKGWPEKLHAQFKSMNWNSIRYCIGFPPERFYEIADSLGFLIQDEYPLWAGPKNAEKILGNLSAQNLANEYTSWMRERWNHPCVVIWDAQNETVTNISGEAIQKVRHLDLSGRPWENGYSSPQSYTDPMEAHPYFNYKYTLPDSFPSPGGMLFDSYSVAKFPDNSANWAMPPKEGGIYPNPVIINEYGWLWVNRDGSPTTLTDRIFKVIIDSTLTHLERKELYARHIGMETEYWRCHRKAAAVMQFCGLGYSREAEPRGQTSDILIDIANVQIDPDFVKYVKPAFSPVGLMLDLWDKELSNSSEVNSKIYFINDTEKEFTGKVNLYFIKGEKKFNETSFEIKITPYGKIEKPVIIKTPVQKGKYEVIAELIYKEETVKSRRKIAIN
jgi:beta-galactosidase